MPFYLATLLTATTTYVTARPNRPATRTMSSPSDRCLLQTHPPPSDLTHYTPPSVPTLRHPGHDILFRILLFLFPNLGAAGDKTDQPSLSTPWGPGFSIH